jgi:hypothetical protein
MKQWDPLLVHQNSHSLRMLTALELKYELGVKKDLCLLSLSKLQVVCRFQLPRQNNPKFLA